jgi:hypothetical protein
MLSDSKSRCKASVTDGLVKWCWQGKIEEERNLSQWHNSHHISHMDCPGINLCPRDETSATSRLSHGTVPSYLLLYGLFNDDFNTRNIEGRSCNPLLQRKSNKYYIFWVCVCSLSYPACNAHGPNCHLWPVWPSCFSTLSHKRHDFRRNIIEHKMWVLILSTNFFSETLLILRIIHRGAIVNVHKSLCKDVFIFFVS